MERVGTLREQRKNDPRDLRSVAVLDRRHMTPPRSGPPDVASDGGRPVTAVERRRLRPTPFEGLEPSIEMFKGLTVGRDDRFVSAGVIIDHLLE